ncbi:Na(+)/H(+) antiporter NhaA [Thiosulfatimonas sediminis]|uniref:Na(+)/H(+) antiporter NhaA n=1 Tax=Thiosulfatimonas sediminis TaxID=2675054 RepID=A0A6F8PRB9_9GAMM|nr:Na+/H+ antiporter NhaA [Thiosulfatimonas sediminis]BBP44659.1 Na(+)/H(+) antiporter NhaA [Thiosulfatimonas sediminis]
MKMPFSKKEYHLESPWERPFTKIITPFESFLHHQMTTGLILIFMTILALYLANSAAYAEAYQHFFHTYFGMSFGDAEVKLTLHHWINDALMAIFFFLVGLEIKREMMVGELSDPKNAILPIGAAVGGMVFPALFYVYFTYGTEAVNGWGIPMATDIAFAISALMILGKRVPPALVTFLVALAIVDDLGAVTVIALFYTADLNLFALGTAFALFGLLLAFNRFGIHRVLPYAIVGILMWAAMLSSGVHATIAGILTALAIPARPKFNPHFFSDHMDDLTEQYKKHDKKDENYMLCENREGILAEMETSIKRVQPPLNRLEHGLHLPVGILIIPIFALANAGVAINWSEMDTLLIEPVAAGVISGLVLGKLIGIFGVAWLMIKFGIARLPSGSSMSQLFGTAFLGGIGFTMSIFIAELAWVDPGIMLVEAKTGILFASVIAAVIGLTWLRFIAKPAPDYKPE